MFEGCLAQRAKELILTIQVPRTTSTGQLADNRRFVKPPMMIPNAEGKPYKLEQVIEASEEETEKRNWWFLPDDNRIPVNLPHSHPWDFESTIQQGRYTERVYWLVDGELRSEERTYRAGEKNVNSKDTYHFVIDVEPGTATHMRCGRANPGMAWGYLDLETLKHVPATKDPTFFAKLTALNPYMEILKAAADAKKQREEDRAKKS
jgi:hypothetical protein